MSGQARAGVTLLLLLRLGFGPLGMTIHKPSASLTRLQERVNQAQVLGLVRKLVRPRQKRGRPTADGARVGNGGHVGMVGAGGGRDERPA